MTSIRDVNFSDIRSLLINNNIAVPFQRNKEEFYPIAEDLIISGKAQYFPDSIIDWIIAKNFLEEGREIKTYREAEINELSDKDLRNLYKFLSNGEQIEDKEARKKSVLNILRFLHKLQYERTAISINPYLYILKNSDADQIYNICNYKELKELCKSPEVRNLLIDKISDIGDDTNLNNYSNEELIKYYQILPYKTGISEFYLLLGNNKVYVSDEYINQMIKFNKDFAVILTNSGKLNSVNLRTGEINDIFNIINEKTDKLIKKKLNEKFWAIFQSDFDFIGLTTTDDYYYFQTKQNQVTLLFTDRELIHDYLAKKYQTSKRYRPMTQSYY